jgi:hypothetical protein
VTALVVGVVLDRSGKKGVDEGSLSKSRLASDLGLSVLSMTGVGAQSFTIMVKAAPRLATILCLRQQLEWHEAGTVKDKYTVGWGAVGRDISETISEQGLGTYIGNANWRCGFGHCDGLMSKCRERRIPTLRESLAEQIKLPNQWSEKKGGPGEL